MNNNNAYTSGNTIHLAGDDFLKRIIMDFIVIIHDNYIYKIHLAGTDFFKRMTRPIIAANDNITMPPMDSMQLYRVMPSVMFAERTPLP